MENMERPTPYCLSRAEFSRHMPRVNQNGAKPTTGPKTVRRVTIAVVDDHTFMRELICSTLARQPEGYEVVASVDNARSAVRECQNLQPDLLILDINLPDQSGIEVVGEIRRLSPKTRILLCTAFASEDRLIESIRSGADGFVEKTNSWDEFLQALHRILNGERYFSTRTVDGLAQPDRTHVAKSQPALSERETEILRLITDALTTKEIAARLGISVATVETHRANLLSKLGVRNVAGLVSYAYRAGIVRVPKNRRT